MLVIIAYNETILNFFIDIKIKFTTNPSAQRIYI